MRNGYITAPPNLQRASLSSLDIIQKQAIDFHDYDSLSQLDDGREDAIHRFAQNYVIQDLSVYQFSGEQLLKQQRVRGDHFGLHCSCIASPTGGRDRCERVNTSLEDSSLSQSLVQSTRREIDSIREHRIVKMIEN